jgi:hypothetical protein
MVLALCPACDQEIPSKASSCQHCNLQLENADAAKIIELRRRVLRDRIYRYRMISYLALALLIGAFGWFLYESDNLLIKPSNGPYILFTIGAVIYLIIRVNVFRCKFALRKLFSR